jgi:anti-sigma regulatory factor (Ser/Thr protein kinase)
MDVDAPRSFDRAAELRLQLAGQPAAVPAARGAVTGLRPVLDDPCSRKVALLVSELVTNAIIHGGATAAHSLSVEVSVSPHVIRVEVCDPGGGLEAPSASAGAEREGGWGLVLVDRTADRWGTLRGENHCVWFEMDRPSASETG